MNEQLLALDISKATGVQAVNLGQGDASGTTIVARIYDNGVEYDMRGKTAVFVMRLPGKAGYVRDDRCVVSGSTVTYVVDERHCCVTRGMTDEAYFDVIVNGVVIASTSRFKVRILRAAESEGLPAGTYDTRVEALIEEMRDTISGGYSLPPATASRLGGVKVGNGISVTSDGTISMGAPIATTSSLGVIKAGLGLQVGTDGTLSVRPGRGVSVDSSGVSYDMPTATASRLGGVKAGASLTVTSDGTLGVKAGNGLALDADGSVALVMPKATQSTVGGVKVGSGIGVVSDGTASVLIDNDTIKVNESGQLYVARGGGGGGSYPDGDSVAY